MPHPFEHGLARMALLCTAFALNGCTTLGPEYQEPTVEWLDDWQTSLYGQVETPEQQTEAERSNWITLRAALRVLPPYLMTLTNSSVHISCFPEKRCPR